MWFNAVVLSAVNEWTFVACLQHLSIRDELCVLAYYIDLIGTLLFKMGK